MCRTLLYVASVVRTKKNYQEERGNEGRWISERTPRREVK